MEKFRTENRFLKKAKNPSDRVEKFFFRRLRP